MFQKKITWKNIKKRDVDDKNALDIINQQRIWKDAENNASSNLRELVMVYLQFRQVPARIIAKYFLYCERNGILWNHITSKTVRFWFKNYKEKRGFDYYSVLNLIPIDLLNEIERKFRNFLK